VPVLAPRGAELAAGALPPRRAAAPPRLLRLAPVAVLEQYPRAAALALRTAELTGALALPMASGHAVSVSRAGRQDKMPPPPDRSGGRRDGGVSGSGSGSCAPPRALAAGPPLATPGAGLAAMAIRLRAQI
jgi:hypothetical protein